MKKNRLFFIAATFVVGVSMFVSCQKAEDVAGQELALKVATVNTADVLNYSDPALVGVPHQFCLVFPQGYKPNGSAKETNGLVQLKVFGDDPSTTDVVELEYWLNIGHESSNTGFCFDYTFTSAGVYYLQFKASGQFIDAEVEVISPCFDPFTGLAVSCGTEREANFTFTSDGTSAIKIQGGLTNFTGEDAVVTVPAGYTATQWTPGGSSNRIIKVEGPASCTPVVINVKWSSENSGGTITGEWTASDDEGTFGEVAGLSCD